ncbi:MAG TPA: hypothetical protein PLZ43_07310 [bacterium]|nr:hypothetical protein [bacterium]
MFEKMKEIEALEAKMNSNKTVYELLNVFTEKMGNSDYFYLFSKENENHRTVDYFFSDGEIKGGIDLCCDYNSLEYIKAEGKKKYLKSWMFPLIEKRMIELVEKRLAARRSEYTSLETLEKWLEMMKQR